MGLLSRKLSPSKRHIHFLKQREKARPSSSWFCLHWQNLEARARALVTSAMLNEEREKNEPENKQANNQHSLSSLAEQGKKAYQFEQYFLTG